MGRIIYNKLVRDRIPEIIQQDGRNYEVEVMPETEYEKALRDKLIEEAQEVIKADNNDLITEWVDIQEIIYALMKLHEVEQDDFEAVRSLRLQARGGFEKRLKLLWTD